ncbi:MAG: hypothetical protein JNM00_05105 [Flavobacteriales bacterium]|nr:hypothetical protein [Flavobacteriales bacterium]
MRKSAMLILACCLAPVLLCQTEAQPPAAEVPAMEEKRLTSGQYRSLALSNEAVIDNNSEASVAWLNLYKAELYSNYTAHSRTLASDSKQRLDEIARNVNDVIPGSFEASYINYLHGNKSKAAFDELAKAYAMRPYEAELWDEMLARAVINGDQAGAKEFAVKLAGSNIYSSAEMEYNRNVLSSTASGSILITYGNADTYPILIQQYFHQFRTDVKVVCLDWFGSEDYRKKVASWLGLTPGSLTTSLSSSIDAMLGSSATCYLTLTLPPAELKKHAARLYLVGLAFRYSTQPVDNLPELDSNWRIDFSKSYIAESEPLNRNYILPLSQLEEYYKITGQTAQHSSVQDLLKRVAGNSGNEKAVAKYLD